MPRPTRLFSLPPLTFLPNIMTFHSNPPKPASPKEHPSPAESDLVDTPVLERNSETYDSVIINSSHGRLDSGDSESYISRRSLSECVPPSGSIPIPSSRVWKVNLAGQQEKEALQGNHFVSDGEPRVFSLFNELQIHFDHHQGGHEAPTLHYGTEASIYSSHFPEGHQLNADFVKAYQLQDELGSGGYGFVMTASDRSQRQEVAVKFIIKDKVPEHAWMEDDSYGRLPTEVVLLSCVNHENIVKCLALFEDELFFYLVQELHGSPWQENHTFDSQPCLVGKSSSSSTTSLPPLSPSCSEASLPVSEPTTPHKMFSSLTSHSRAGKTSDDVISSLLDAHLSIGNPGPHPEITRRPSHDLFECIEQSENKRLTEEQARYVFAQVVDAVAYLDSIGVAHRDIKDENLVIDKNLKIKLIDFGSATAVDPSLPRPFYQMFFGTAAYASSEILLKNDYQAAPAEIWTLGVLLSYLLAGISPFPNIRDAVEGRILLSHNVTGSISDEAMELMHRCLHPDPKTRATISEVRQHPWLQSKH